jgi:membrane associated rhomboid family serine protease
VYSSGEGVPGAGTVPYAAHVVGFLTGMLLAWPLRAGTPSPPEPGRLLWGRQARHTW